MTVTAEDRDRWGESLGDRGFERERKCANQKEMELQYSIEMKKLRLGNVVDDIIKADDCPEEEVGHECPTWRQ